MHLLYKVDLLSQQDKLYLKSKTPAVFKELFFCKSQTPQLARTKGRTLLIAFFIVFNV